MDQGEGSPDGHHSHDGVHDGRSFDERARDWDDERKVDRARVVAAAVREAVTFDGTTRLLEYGAGTGLATQFLAEGPVGHVTLVDPAAGMREVMAEKVADGRLPGDTTITDSDLGASDVAASLAASHDVVLTVMALHHVADPRAVLDGFAAVLADSGHVCIVDLAAEDGSFHAHTDFEVHDGFEPAELQEWLEAAGFVDVVITTVHEMEKDGRMYPLFLAVGRRAADELSGAHDEDA